MKAIISPKLIKSCLTATLCCSEMSRESVQLLLADVFLLQGKKILPSDHTGNSAQALDAVYVCIRKVTDSAVLQLQEIVICFYAFGQRALVKGKEKWIQCLSSFIPPRWTVPFIYIQGLL